MPTAVPPEARRVVDHVRPWVADGLLLGFALHGSAVQGGLRPDCDVDLLLVCRRSLTGAERRHLTELLLSCSGRRATLTPGRPLEVVAVVRDDVVPWRYPPVVDYLYGEWERDEYEAGHLPEAHADPDLALLLAAARDAGRALLGSPPSLLLAPVPDHDLVRAVHACVPAVMDDLVGDERNVLLTLARMVVTVEQGRIVPKDVAARDVAPRLAPAHRALLDRARLGYLGEVHDDWTAIGAETAAAAAALASWVTQQGIPSHT